MTNLFDIDQEKQVISYVINKEGSAATNAWITVKEIIDTPLMYYARDHRLIAVAIDQLVSNDMPIDIYSLADELGKINFRNALDILRKQQGRGTGGLINLAQDDEQDMNESLLTAIGGMPVLVELAQIFLPQNSLKKVCLNIRENYWKRRGQQITADFTEAIQQPGAVYLDEYNRMNERMSALGEEKHQTHDIGTLIEKAKRRPLEKVFHTAHWPLAELDLMMPLRQGRLYILAGPSGSGKSSLGAQIATTTAKAYGKKSVLYASIEMDCDEIANLIISQEAHVPVQKIEKGGLSESELMSIQREIDDVEQSNGIAVLDFESPSHADIKQVAKTMQATSDNLKLIVVDHIQILSGTDPRQSEYERLSEISRSLKMMAKQLKVVVVALCQLNRSSMDTGYSKEGKARGQAEPQLKDLRGSGTLEQDSNGVVMVWNRDATTDNPTQHKTICIKKNRTGSCGMLDVVFHAGHGQYFKKMSEAEREELITNKGNNPWD